MKVAIESIDLPNEHGLFGYTEMKVRAALRLLDGQIKSVHVHLEDVNGPALGGVDKHCRVAVALHGFGGCVIDDVHSDARAAVELVAARVDQWAQRQAAQLRRPASQALKSA